MDGRRAFRTTVQSPSPGLCLIRVTGHLDRSAAASVLRVVDAQLQLVACGRRTITDLVIDVEAVDGMDVTGLRALRHAVYSTGRRGIGLYVSGGGMQSLPVNVRRLLSGFRTFPSAEVAVDALGTPAPAVPSPRLPVEEPSRTGVTIPPGG